MRCLSLFRPAAKAAKLMIDNETGYFGTCQLRVHKPWFAAEQRRLSAGQSSGRVTGSSCRCTKDRARHHVPSVRSDVSHLDRTGQRRAGRTRPLKSESFGDILVSMTRNVKSSPTKPTKSRRRARDPKLGQWLLQDAKARFSELVRRVRSEGPQRVTVHGRDEVVVISAEEVRSLKGGLLTTADAA